MFHLASIHPNTKHFTGEIVVDMTMKYKPLRELKSSENKEQLSVDGRRVTNTPGEKKRFKLLVDVKSPTFADIPSQVSYPSQRSPETLPRT